MTDNPTATGGFEAATDHAISAERIAAGLVPYGPEHPDYPNAPSDWDGGAYLCRDGGMYYMRGYGWEHGMYCTSPTSDFDRVAYRAILQKGEA